MHHKIDVVFVTYKPDINIFNGALNSIKNQVRAIFVIDNSACMETYDELINISKGSKNIEILQLNTNTGIARAQNIGIIKCIENHADFTLLSDQDTIYPDNFIRQMFSNYDSIPDKSKVAAIAPNFSDTNRGGKSEGFLLLDGVNSVITKSNLMVEEVSQVIASGMIINNDLLPEVGMMEEDLFIDWVDYEWCWRAISKGYRIIGCNNIIIKHKLGDFAVAIRGKVYLLHSPERNYYIVRNGVYISLTKKYLPFRMRCNIFLKSVRYMIGFSLFCNQHKKNIKYCSQGFYHGLIGRVGPY